MKRRTRSQWLSLIHEFEQSGLTQSAFCAKRGLNAKYFSLRRMKLKASTQQSPFVEAVVAEHQQSERVSMRYGAVTIELPGTSVQVIAQLAKALST